MKKTFKGCCQNKLRCPTFRPFPFEFQVLFQVVGNGREVHHLVRLFEAYRIDLPQAHELGKCAEDGFHRTLAFALHVPALWTFHSGDVTLIICPVISNTELFHLCTLS